MLVSSSNHLAAIKLTIVSPGCKVNRVELEQEIDDPLNNLGGFDFWITPFPYREFGIRWHDVLDCVDDLAGDDDFDTIFKTWAVGVNFIPIMVGAGDWSPLQDEIYDNGVDGLVMPHLAQLFDLLDPVIVKLPEQEINVVSALTVWNYRAYDYQDWEGGIEWDSEVKLAGLVEFDPKNANIALKQVAI